VFLSRTGYYSFFEKRNQKSHRQRELLRTGVSFTTSCFTSGSSHTASIFPYQIGLWQSENTCELAQHPESGQFRVTLSGSVINNSKAIFFLVTGANKAEKVKEIHQKEGDYKSYPASLVKEEGTVWLMDKEAAQLI
jgi:6-phosphogluconolactonase/glucosamine-6-phosphate isomerase/deaminase